jgi:hypothetical protein
MASNFSRRTVLAAGGAALVTGASGLIVPAQAKGVAPTPSMRGGANNYRPGAPIVDRIGSGGFWMTGLCAGQGTARHWLDNGSRFGLIRQKDMNVIRRATALL